MFLYYFVRSTLNQIRRFIRTWAFLMLIIFLTIGGFVIYAVRWYYVRLSSMENLLPETFMEFFAEKGLRPINALELAVGILILAMLVIQIIGAEKSVTRVFLQADANLLFASPLTPQTVLIFRLMSTLGISVFVVLVLFLQIPVFISRFHLSFYAALTIPLAWCLLLVFSVLLKVLIYEVGSLHPFFRKNLRWFVFSFLGIIGIWFYHSYRASEEQYLLLSAHRFLNAPITRWIPVWGWIKGFLLSALSGDVIASLSFLGMCIALILVLSVLVQRMPTDYYEDMLSRTQEIALIMEQYKRDGVRSFAAILSRSSRTGNTGNFHFGRGSSVYFYKAVYNRFHSSFLRFFTRTGITYLIAALVAGLCDRIFLDDPIPFIPVLVLSVMVIFRTIFSPVTEDIQKASFLLQPEPIWSKLFFSLLGGICNCGMDVLFPLMAGRIAAGFSPLPGLMYLPFLMSVDFFASAAGAFVDVSLPRSIGVTFRQVVQILLLYVGLVFDGMLLVGGITSRHTAAGFVLVTLVNLVFGAFFTGLTGVWLYPCSGLPIRSAARCPDQMTAEAKRHYATLGFAFASMFLAIHLSQSLFHAVLKTPPILTIYLPIYAIGFPIFLLALRLMSGPQNVPHEASSRFGLREFLLAIPVCFFVIYSGSAIGNALQGLLHSVKVIPISLDLLLPEITDDYPGLQAFFLVVLSPVMEEFVFRRCVIDRVCPYGKRAALYGSALLFGLFHGTVPQLCYAFLLGLVFGYIYIRTGRIRYSIALHVLINALSTLVLPALLVRVAGSGQLYAMSGKALPEVLGVPGIIPLLLYLAFLFISSLFGAVIFLFILRERQLSREGVRVGTALTSSGMITFTLITCVYIFVTV